MWGGGHHNPKSGPGDPHYYLGNFVVYSMYKNSDSGL